MFICVKNLLSDPAIKYLRKKWVSARLNCTTPAECTDVAANYTATAASSAATSAISGCTADAAHYPFASTAAAAASTAVAYTAALGYNASHYAKASYYRILGYAATAAGPTISIRMVIQAMYG